MLNEVFSETKKKKKGDPVNFKTSLDAFDQVQEEQD
jgi:hypothetical protein